MFRLSLHVTWLALVCLILYFADVGHGFRILEPGTTTPQGDYFKPFDKGFVGIYGDPTNLQRERINEGAFETSDSELLYEGVSPRQSCPNMVGPFSDGNYYCSAREYGYCDRRSGTCFCNAGYFGIDCSECSDSHFRYNNGGHCFPKKLCPNDCSGSGECNFATGTCSCLEHRTGTSCETLLCTKHSSLCDTCTNDECLKCASGYFLTGNKSEVCKTCYVFDPRCAGCTLEEGCTVCADSTLTSVRRSGYRLSGMCALSLSSNYSYFIDLYIFTISSSPIRCILIHLCLYFCASFRPGARAGGDESRVRHFSSLWHQEP